MHNVSRPLSFFCHSLYVATIVGATIVGATIGWAAISVRTSGFLTRAGTGTAFNGAGIAPLTTNSGFLTRTGSAFQETGAVITEVTASKTVNSPSCILLLLC